ncbi:PAS domain-containing protein [uncultured Paracoccus sp.]|uniref:PAS domain-containing protein n=1 Tax=uncultured Paracoccus sp. TaxID=189685 RepID=UPI00260F532C|nr:PAS domain-containing protein [uncultured Paracoccus sp.]
MSLSGADGANLHVISGTDDSSLRSARSGDDGGRLVGASLALALLRTIREAAYVMDCDGRVTFINAAGLTRLGNLNHPQRVYGSFLWDLWLDAPAEDLRRAVGEAAEGEATLLEAVDCPGSGTCSVAVSPVEDATGRVMKILVLVRED